MKHVLSISTLYPNPVEPDTGWFVARSLQELAKLRDNPDHPEGGGESIWQVTVINPIGIPPVALGRYRDLAQLEPKAEEGGIAVHRPHFTAIPRIGARRDASAIAKVALPIARRIHEHNPIDLVAAQLFYPDGPAAAYIAQEIDVPLSIKARGEEISEWGDNDHARKEMLEAAQRADGVLAVSEALKRGLARLGMDRGAIEVHHTGLDRNRFRPLDHDRLRSQLAEELGFAMPVNAPLLVCVGPLSEQNGQDIAIAALASVEGAKLILVGEGEDETHLRSLAADLALAERVHFAGSLDHDILPLVLSAADAMVLPTRREGLANAWIQALACGTPVVTTDIGEAREVIAKDTAGRLVQRSPESVAAGLNALLNDPPLRREVAAHATGFSWERHASELAAHYDRLLASSDRARP